jgi:hypothetical protein
MDAGEWNRVLLDAVFSTEHGSGPVRIIRATDSFLAASAPESARAGDSVRSRFLQSLGRTPNAVRDLFDHDLQMQRWQANPGPPPFFSQLYFSLLVASATEATHDVGVYRQRLCSMLELPPGDYVNKGLPDLWRELERWTRRENRLGRPVRQLSLPKPGRETIIGYSKRLAFPGFSDFVRLANALHETDLSHESPLHTILQCIGRRLESFSDQFKGEYVRLRGAADRSPQSVYMQPLWAAIEAASFEPTGTARRVRPRFAIELSTDHFGQLSAQLFTDKSPDGRTDEDWRVLPASESFGNFVFRLVPRNASSVLEAILSDSKTSGRILSKSPIAKLLRQGCLVFAPNDDSPWLWRASLPMAGPARILCRDAPLALLRRVVGTAMSRSTRIPDAPGWTLLETDDCSPIARSTSVLDGLDQFDSLRPGVVRQQIVFIRPIRLPDGILVNRACRADLLAIGCDEVAVTNADGSQDTSNRHTLDISDNSYMFRLGLEVAPQLPLPARLTFTGSNDGEMLVSRTVMVSASVLDSLLTDKFDATACLIESPYGQLVGAASSSGPPWVDNETDLSSVLKMPTIEPGTQSPPRGLGPTDLLARWDDVEEALYAAFLNAKALSGERIAELMDIVIPCRSYSAHIGPTLLWQSFKVIRRWARRWYGSSYFPVIPHLRLVRGSNRVDLVGLTCRRLRDRLGSLHPRVSRVTVIEGIGPTPTLCVNGIDEGEARDLATRLGLTLRIAEIPALPSVADILRRMTPRYRVNLAALEILFWNPRAQRFGDARDRSGPIELRVSVLDRGQRIYGLHDSDRFLWATESRVWASLVYRILTGAPVFSRTADRLLAPQPLPFLFAEAAAGGIGVAVRMTDRGLAWSYQFANSVALDQFLIPWTARRAVDRGALLRWTSASAESLGQHRARALARRYGSSNFAKSPSGKPRD